MGVGGSAALDITRSVGLVVDVDEPRGRTRTETHETVDRIKGRERITLTRIDRSPSVNLMVAFRGRAGRRVSVATLCGVSWTGERSAFGTRTESLGPDGQVTGVVDQPPAWDRYLWLGLAGGIEVPIRITGRLSIVPDLRGIWFPLAENGNSIGRLGVSARWRF